MFLKIGFEPLHELHVVQGPCFYELVDIYWLQQASKSLCLRSEAAILYLQIGQLEQTLVFDVVCLIQDKRKCIK